jgi:NADH-quinone oxidoreductase subunit G/NADP-reducing hydrogenase subunit HndD
MQYYALATDYDGTLAKDGRVDEYTIDVLKRFQASGRKLVLVTGRELPFEGLHVTPIVGLEQIKTADIKIEDPLPGYKFLDGVVVKIAVTSGLAGAKILMEQVKGGESPYHFIEVMGCPNGCIMGGGQPRSKDPDVRIKRLRGIYDEDEAKAIRKSHENPSVKALYEEYLESPGSHIAHELLHTHYVKRGRFNEFLDYDYMKNEVEPMSDHSGYNTESRKKEPGVKAARRVHDDMESVRVMALEAEVNRLKQELNDSRETVEILKEVMNDYTQKPKRKE